MTFQNPEFRFDRPGALIAALPAVLGFVPEKSLVLVSLEDGRMGAVMRADLAADLTDNIDRLAEIAATSGADSVVAVIVDADGALCPMCNVDHRQLCDALTDALAEHAVGLSADCIVDVDVAVTAPEPAKRIATTRAVDLVRAMLDNLSGAP
jgi:uncharacterized protein YbjQ (UPF0145 family)